MLRRNFLRLRRLYYAFLNAIPVVVVMLGATPMFLMMLFPGTGSHSYIITVYICALGFITMLAGVLMLFITSRKD